MNANYKQFIGPLVILLIGFTAGTFYGKSGNGRWRVEGPVIVDTRSGQVRPVIDAVKQARMDSGEQKSSWVPPEFRDQKNN